MSIFDVLFVDVRHILKIYRSRFLFNYLILQVMAFMTLKIIVFEKYKFYLILPFFSFVLLIPVLIKERSHTALLAFEEGSIEHIYGAKYDFTTSTAFSRKF